MLEMVPGISADRLVAVIAETASGRKRIGSGYLLDATRVLTAWHCTVDENDQDAVSISVVAPLGVHSHTEVKVSRGESSRKLDVALLTVNGEPPWAAELTDGPVKFGKLDRRYGGRIDCGAAGFPRWQETSGASRHVGEVHGPVLLLEGIERRRGVLRAPDLTGVAVNSGSPWAGYSGSPVVYEDLFLGVVLENDPDLGPTALPFRPLQAIAEDDDDDSRELAHALGIDNDEALSPLWDLDTEEQQGWSLDSDPDDAERWRSSARGVSNKVQDGWRFRGRAKALERLISWLDRPRPDRQVLVVTGSPGAGKSAVLSWIVVTADSGVRAEILADDTADHTVALASLRLVSCAVHAKGKNAMDVAKEIARAARAAPPREPADLAANVREALEGQGGRFNVIIDELDEMNPQEARDVIDHVVLTLAKNCADAGVQVLVGARRRNERDDLLRIFGPDADVINLDESDYFEQGDLSAYAQACLQMDGGDNNPFSDPAVAGPLASRIAHVSEKNFLIAALIAKSYSEHPESADPAQLTVPETVYSALKRYLELLAPLTGVLTPVPHLPAHKIVEVSAEDLLTALAFAEPPGGLPAELWQLAIKELYRTDVAVEALAEFAHSAAGNFLVQMTDATAAGSGGLVVTPTYQLYHQALSDTLLHSRSNNHSRVNDEQKLTNAFIAFGRAGGWQDNFRYLLRSLPAHAGRADLVDDLLTDSTYLLHADLYRMVQVSGQSDSPYAKMLRLTPQALPIESPAERAAMFSVTEALEQLGTTYRNSPYRVPYRAQWAVVRPRAEHAAFETRQHAVYSVCTVTIDGHGLLASSGADGTVRLWDPLTGQQHSVLDSRQHAVPDSRRWREVRAVCVIPLEGRDLLASGHEDGAVRLWDPITGQQHTQFDRRIGYRHIGHMGSVQGMCAVVVDAQTLLATCGTDGTVRLWDPLTGQQHSALQEHHDGRICEPIYSVCTVSLEGRDLLATGHRDGAVRLWDPRTGQQRAQFNGHRFGVGALCTLTVDEKYLLASGGTDARVRLWDPRTGQEHAVFDGRQHAATVDGPDQGILESHDAIGTLCTVTVDGRDLLAGGGGLDGRVRLWDPRTGQQRAMSGSHTGPVRGLCMVTANGHDLLASGGQDGTVRLWNVDAERSNALNHGHQGAVPAICAITVGGRDLVATGGDDGTARLWDLRDGEQFAVLGGGHGLVGVVCAVTVGGRKLLASAGGNGTVRLWDPLTAQQITVLGDRHHWVDAVCGVTVDGRGLVATGGDDGTVRLWDPLTAQQISVLNGYHNRIERHPPHPNGHRRGVRTICAVTVGGRKLLASGGGDRTVRLWDPLTAQQITVLEGLDVYDDSPLCAVTVGGQELIATGERSGKVRLWYPRTGQQHSAFDSDYSVDSLCAITSGGWELLATGGYHMMAQLWDPRTGDHLANMPTHHRILNMTAIGDSLVIALSVGVLVTTLSLPLN